MSEFDHFVGTREVNGPHAFDIPALSAYLQQHLPGFDGPLTVEMFKGGQSNPTYKLITPGRAYVMRAKPGPVARLLPSAHAVEREFKVMQGLAGTDVPVAKMHCLCEDESVIGRAFFVMEFVSGRVMFEQSLPGLTPSERGAIYAEMGRVIAALHSLDWAALGLADYGRPGNYFARQIDRWSKQYRATEDDSIAAMNALIDWLPSRIPANDEASIVHGDFRLDNLIFDAIEPRVKAVIDWELSTLGHPLADLSYHCLTWRLSPDLFRGAAGLDLAALGIPSESDYVRRYCERTGRSFERVMADWDFYMAYNLFRLAAILQGVAVRARQGMSASAGSLEEARRVRPLAELAWSIASQSAN